MFFTKYPHRANFSFAEGYDEATGALTAGSNTFQANVTSHEGDIYHVRIAHPKLWGENLNLETLEVPAECKRARLKTGKGFSLSLTGQDGKALITGQFGVSGNTSMFAFKLGGDARFFGMGEKNFGRVELSGLRSKFWNTDVWSDFHYAQWGEYPTDPSYFSLPYLVAKIGDEYVGFLLHNPYPAYMETPGTDDSRVFVEWQRTSTELQLGNEGGEPNLWIIYGPTLPELTRKLQKLVGTTPLPPAWALGYHQSRWGYGGHDDLLHLDAEFEKYKIPCDSLWLDLDYMNGFRIFDTSKEMFPHGAAETASLLAKNGRRIVPILDPGVKFESGYSVYEDGHAKGVFCMNVEGKEFIGMVWPGETVFPDFSQSKSRDWWAGYVKKFAQEGFGATWLDMNDPSTGPVDPQGMLFNKGKAEHAAYHNQYALGMQMASRAGFLKARPKERPFLLSRSGFIGTSKHAAIWSGDNLSNYFYLKISIPTAIGMSISGIPFSGPDIGGFGGDVTDPLMLDWVKAGFLFPFFRNHSVKDSRPQEPYAFPKPVMSVLRRYIRLRYKLFPYLYNLFAQQETDGDPMLRPLFYEFGDAGLEKIDDQFMVGAAFLQAPFVEENAKTRAVTLPGAEPWFETSTGNWLEAGSHTVKQDRLASPVYIRSGAIVPMQAGTPTDNKKDLAEVHFHVFVPPSGTCESEIVYHSDDGISFDYKTGARSTLKAKMVALDGNVAIVTDAVAEGFGPIDVTWIFHGTVKDVRVNGAQTKLSSAKLTLTGKELKAQLAAL